MFKTFFFRELEDLEVLRQEVTKPRAEVEFNKTPLKVTLFLLKLWRQVTPALKISELLQKILQTGLKQRQNGGVAISPTVQQNDELAGSFKNSVNRSVEAEF